MHPWRVTQSNCCHSPTQPNSSQVGVTRFLVCNPPHPPTTHQTNSVLFLFNSAVSRELQPNTDKSYKIEFGPKKIPTQILFTQKNFRPKFFLTQKNFWPNFFLPKKISNQIFFYPKKILTQIFLTKNNLIIKI